MNKIAVVGECMVELNLLKEDVYKQAFSGDSLNCSLHLKSILNEAEVEYITVLGEDQLSKKMLDFLYEQNIQTNYINILKNKNPIMYINNENSSPTYFSSDLQKRDIFESNTSESVMNKLLDFDLIYFSANSVAMMSKNGRVSFFKIIKKLRAYGVKIVFDSIYLPIVHESSDDARKLYETSIHYADILLTSLWDEKKLWGDIESKHITQKAQLANCNEVIIKCENEEIAYSFERKLKKIKIKELNDKSIFNGAYLAMRLKNNSIKESIINATNFNM
mgnify:CR=1 FL=1